MILKVVHCFIFYSLNSRFFVGPHYENTEISAYVTRGSVALLEEIDQSNNDVINDDIINEENHVYVNVKISRISTSSLGEYMLKNTANGNFLKEFQVYFLPGFC